MVPPATPEQIHELSWRLARKFTDDDFEVWYRTKCLSPDENTRGAALREYRFFQYSELGSDRHLLKMPGQPVERSAGELCIDELKETLRARYLEAKLDKTTSAMATHFAKILASDRANSVNVNDLQAAQRVVSALVQQDRLPRGGTNLEGLQLLRQCWDEHDVALHLGAIYRALSHVFYLAYLLLGIAMVTFTVLHSQQAAMELSSADEQTSATSATSATFSHIVFGLSLGASFVLSLQGYFNPTIRANQLKSAAASLESLTWLYRARVGQFKLTDNSFSKRSENALMTSLNRWRKDLVAETDLQQTDLQKRYPRRVYHHYQQACPSKVRRKAEKNELKRDELLRRHGLEEATEASKAVSQEQRVPTANKGAAPKLAEAMQKQKRSRITPDSDEDEEMGGAQNEAPQTQDERLPSLARVVGDLMRSDTAPLAMAMPSFFGSEEDAEKGDLTSQYYERVAEQKVAALRNMMDDHQSPITAEAYIQLRVLPVIETYRHAIPGISRRKTLLQLVLFVCTSAGAALSYAGWSQYVAIISAVATAIGSWMAYEALGERLVRFSSTVRALEEMISWWSSLDAASKGNVGPITHLVQSGEHIITSERRVWQTMAPTEPEETSEGTTSKGRGGTKSSGSATDDDSKK